MNGLGRPSVRAVVYTRKSSEEGLDQEFNSLDAQYEACTAYIASQRHEGWKLVKQRFDDGGVSGGTMDRPALKALLDEVDKGLVDMIVVYKIDRLTRSLSDFARLIERLETSWLLLCISHPILQYLQLHGKVNPERLIILRSV